MKPRAYFLFALLLVAFLATNTFALRPGIGGRRDKTPGTELERYFGWPAVWRAELWDSTDPTLARRILKQAPFYWPAGEMQLRRRYDSPAAAAVNFASLLFCCSSVVLFNVPAVGPGWRVGLGVLLAIGLLASGLLANSVAAHL